MYELIRLPTHVWAIRVFNNNIFIKGMNHTSRIFHIPLVSKTFKNPGHELPKFYRLHVCYKVGLQKVHVNNLTIKSKLTKCNTWPAAFSALKPPEARVRSAHTWAYATFSTYVKSYSLLPSPMMNWQERLVERNYVRHVSLSWQS